MELMIALAVSISINFFLALSISKSIKKYKLEINKKDALLLEKDALVKQPVKSIELQEFLADLMAGKKGLFAVQRLNTDDLMLRSPRNRND